MKSKKNSGTWFPYIFGGVFLLSGLRAIFFGLERIIKSTPIGIEGGVMTAIIGVIFTAFGCGYILMTRWGVIEEAHESARALQYPNQPWMWQKQWVSPHMKSDSKFVFWGCLGFTVFFNLFVWSIFINLFDEVINAQNKLQAASCFILPIVGLLMIYATYKLYWQWRYFGDTQLILDTHPAPLGDTFFARLLIPHHPPEDTVFTLLLTCSKTVAGGDTDHTSVVWQDEQYIAASEGVYDEAFQLPIRFNIPKTEAETTVTLDYPRYRWVLKAKAKANRVAFEQEFELPVFDPKRYDFSLSHVKPIGGALLG